MVGLQQFHRTPEDGASRLLDGHAGCQDGAWAGRVGVVAGQVRQDADPYGIGRRLSQRRNGGGQSEKSRADVQGPAIWPDHGVPPVHCS